VAGPVVPAGSVARPLSAASLVLVGLVAALLIAGYVTLAALGRDTSGYALFLGGPAVTAVLGLILNHRVGTVAAAVDATQAQTTAVVAETVSGLDTHLAAQDQTLGEIHAGVIGDPVPPPPTGQRVPGQRESDDAAAPISLFGPMRPRA
jgi:hypothetical protein